MRNWTLADAIEAWKNGFDSTYHNGVVYLIAPCNVCGVSFAKPIDVAFDSLYCDDCLKDWALKKIDLLRDDREEILSESDFEVYGWQVEIVDFQLDNIHDKILALVEEYHLNICPDCNGSGKSSKLSCKSCNGIGYTK